MLLAARDSFSYSQLAFFYIKLFFLLAYSALGFALVVVRAAHCSMNFLTIHLIIHFFQFFAAFMRDSRERAEQYAIAMRAKRRSFVGRGKK
jgi:hypothetical protein